MTPKSKQRSPGERCGGPQPILNRRKVTKMRVQLCALALFCGTASASTGTADEVRSVKGLKAVMVVVEELSPEAQLIGLRKAALQTDVEKQLSQAGVRVLKAAAEWDTSGHPALYVQIFTVSSGSGV